MKPGYEFSIRYMTCKYSLLAFACFSILSKDTFLITTKFNTSVIFLQIILMV